MWWRATFVSHRNKNAWLSAALRMNGWEVTTIEKVGTPKAPHPIQSAFVKHSASQCGALTKLRHYSTWKQLENFSAKWWICSLTIEYFVSFCHVVPMQHAAEACARLAWLCRFMATLRKVAQRIHRRCLWLVNFVSGFHRCTMQKKPCYTSKMLQNGRFSVSTKMAMVFQCSAWGFTRLHSRQSVSLHWLSPHPWCQGLRRRPQLRDGQWSHGRGMRETLKVSCDVKAEQPDSNLMWNNIWLVVWNIFHFSIYWEEYSQLTFIFFRGVAQHQPDMVI